MLETWLPITPERPPEGELVEVKDMHGRVSEARRSIDPIGWGAGAEDYWRANNAHGVESGRLLLGDERPTHWRYLRM